MAQTADQLMRWARETMPELRQRLARTHAAIGQGQVRLAREHEPSTDKDR